MLIAQTETANNPGNNHHLAYCIEARDDYIPRNIRAQINAAPESIIIEAQHVYHSAYAQSIGGAGGGILELMFPLVLVGGIMWFLVIRPQRAQQKARAEMLSNVRRSDTVVTGGGLVGKVTKVIDDTEIEVQIAPDVKVRAMRSMLADVRVKGEAPKNDNVKPAKEAKSTKAEKATKAKAAKTAKTAKATKADDTAADESADQK